MNYNITSTILKNKKDKNKIIGNIQINGPSATVKFVKNKITNEKYAFDIYEKLKLNMIIGLK